MDILGLVCDHRLAYLSLLVCAFLLGAALGLAPAVLAGLPAQAPIEFRAAHALPHPADGCVGDRLTYDYALEVHGPVKARVDVSVKRPGVPDHVAAGENADAHVFNMPESGVVTGTQTFAIPAGLSPGRYERVVGVHRIDMAAPAAFLSVPFTVRDDCR